MQFDKLTARFQQALQQAHSLALGKDNPYLEAGHVLKALLDDKNSGMGALLANAGADLGRLQSNVAQSLASLPRVSGQGGEPPPNVATPTLPANSSCWR